VYIFRCTVSYDCVHQRVISHLLNAIYAVYACVNLLNDFWTYYSNHILNTLNFKRPQTKPKRRFWLSVFSVGNITLNAVISRYSGSILRNFLDPQHFPFLPSPFTYIPFLPLLSLLSYSRFPFSLFPLPFPLFLSSASLPLPCLSFNSPPHRHRPLKSS